MAYESLCSAHAHPLGAGAANMTLRSPFSAWTFAFVLCLSLLLISLTGNLMGDWLRDELDPRLRNVR